MGNRRRVWLNSKLENNAVNFETIKGGFDVQFIGKTQPFNDHDGLIVETWRNEEGGVMHVILAHETDKSDVAAVLFVGTGEKTCWWALREDGDRTYSFHPHSHRIGQYMKDIYATTMAVVEADISRRLLI